MLGMEETEEYTDLEVRKVNGGRPRFVTEERLKSWLGVFAIKIQHEIKDGHSQLRNDFKDEIGKLSTAIKGNYPNKNAAYRKQNDSRKFSFKKIPHVLLVREKVISVSTVILIRGYRKAKTVIIYSIKVQIEWKVTWFLLNKKS